MDFDWSIQNDRNDYKTNFIYHAETEKEVEVGCIENGCDLNYALHRWYNFKTSITCEALLVQYGCIKEADSKNKTIDLYFKGTPYDVKLTVFPKKYTPFNMLQTRAERDNLIKWFYNNQSKQGRFHLANRLFIVCIDKDNDYIKSIKLKCRFDIIENKIKSFCEFYKDRELNRLFITTPLGSNNVCSDIIRIME